MPPYYAQQMAARNHLPLRVASDTASPADDLDVTATRSEDGSALVLKVVNMGGGIGPTSLSMALRPPPMPMCGR